MNASTVPIPTIASGERKPRRGGGIDQRVLELITGDTAPARSFLPVDAPRNQSTRWAL